MSLLGAIRAWRARARRDGEACARHAAGVLRVAFPEGTLDGPIVDCAPRLNTNGGFFCATATSATGSRYFTKAIAGWSGEARFWRAWRGGAVKVEGQHFRIEPPAAIADGRQVMVLAFPELDYLRTNFRKRDGIYARRVRRVVQAVAEFNALHPAAAGLTATARYGRLRVPGTAEVAAALALGQDEARAIVARLREVEARWETVRRRVATLPGCLGHMDLGPSNIVIHEGRGVIIDFGHAGRAPVGADLHTVLRYGGGAEAEALLDIYAETFAEAGAELDRAAAALALKACFAVRYRNLKLRSARDPAVFRRALALSEMLVAEVGAPPG